ncbi:sulfotransferase family protein [Desulfoplanes formicivorans]|uniref:Sulfotransferase n=1 Tax=Desulfoplanes formicivorans TaxID=1592317 RepID=A0A194AE05_9BACT|nr:sulfotransferase [Desulfoplanes formicivorans]GAU07361.1 sulfotransferase [Desulfoplanes formicivorans]
MNKPNFFIVGEPKSGTTALHDFLDQHPQITMSTVKEPYHFCTDLHQESDQFHKKRLYFKYRDQDKYLSLFKQDKLYDAVGESSTFYIWSKDAAKNIHSFNPDAKIIIFLRNPIDFIYSLHSHWVVETYENITSFEEALRAETERKINWQRIPSRAYFPSMLYYTSMANYASKVSRFYKYFDRDQVKVFVFEDFKKNNANIFQNILKFLEVDQTFEPQYKKVNASKKPRCPALNYVAQNVYFIEGLKKIMPMRVHRMIKHAGQKMLWKETAREKMPEDIRYELTRKFFREVKSISDVLQRDMVRYWNFKI